MRIWLSVVIQLFDGYCRRPIRVSEVSFMVNHSIAHPIYKPNGYFVFTNLPPGFTRIDILSQLFLPEVIEISVCEEPGKYPFIYKSLSPGKGYPFMESPTVIKGKLFRTDGAPVSNETVRMYAPGEREPLKVAQDDLKAGDTKIRLFSVRQVHRLPIPGNFLICDANGARRESCFITGVYGEGGYYSLEKPLRFGHTRATPLAELIEFQTGSDGSFSIAIPERFETAREIEIAAEDAKYQIAFIRGRETDIGNAII